MTPARTRRTRLHLSLSIAALAMSVIAGQATAQNAIYPVVVNNVADPLFANLAIPANAATAGMWSGVTDWPIVAIHATLLPDGRVLTFGAAQGGQDQDGRTLVFWDPRKGFDKSALTVLPNAQNVDSFCASATLLNDGKLLTSGGASYSTGYSSRESMVLDWRTSAATRDYDLTAQRWYATMTKLPDGRAIITGGGAPYASADPNRAEAANDISSTPEVYTPGKGWASLTGAYSTDAFGAKNARWWYPRQWVSPAGTVFGISTEKMWEMKLDGNGSIKTLGNFKTAADNNTKPNVGPTSSAVMYDTGRILQVGGNGYYNGYGSPSSNLATMVDITGIGSGRVTVTEARPMAYGRQWPTAVVLPNGRVLVEGGSTYADQAGDNAVLPVEIWDGATGNWTTGAPSAVYRGYHSTAALLPDGAVLVAGGGIPGPVLNLNAQIYYPPYLFQQANGGSVLAARPKIVSLSTVTSNYNQTIDIQTATGDTVSEVSLIANASVTHGFDSNQRRLKLSFTQTNNGVKVTMPASANLAPPGYYMLSVLNNVRVPSTGVVIAVAAAAPGAMPTTSAPVDTQIGYAGNTVAAATDGTVATVNINNEMWVLCPGCNGNWTKLPQTFMDAGVIANGRYYAVGTDKMVYRWTSSSNAWVRVGRDAKVIATASDGTVAVANSENGSIWVKTADDNAESWRMVPNAIAKKLALVSNKSLYYITPDNGVYRTDMTTNPVRVGRDAVSIAASSDGTITVVGIDGSIWRKSADDTTEVWSQLAGTAKAIASVNAQTLITALNDGSIMRR